MKNFSWFLIGVLLFGSCTSSREFSNVVSGGSLGGLFGSAVGGLLGGPRGSDTGTAIGVVAGAVIGSASSRASSHSRQTQDEYSYDTSGGDTGERVSKHRENVANPMSVLEVSDIRFYDTNNNRALDAGEQAYIEMNIYNNSSTTLYDLVPHVTSNNKHVRLSPPAVISELPSGRGVLYRVTVLGGERLKKGDAQITVSIGKGKQSLKHFRIRTQR